MFIDRVRIHAKSGNGGNGCASFRREKFIPKGGPDGGDGGDGGDVILKADIHHDQLASLFFQPILRAKNGDAGSSRQKHGKSAPDLIIPVPVGTLVYRIPSPGIPLAAGDEANIPEVPAPDPIVEKNNHDETTPVLRKKLAPPDPADLVADLSEIGQEAIICLGGHGGRGNIHFKSSRNRAPRRFTEGTEGEEGWFLMELRTIAFAGLVGYPNAGKSTLLRALSAAHPKVAAYAFTTRHPQVGVVDLGDYQRTTVADIPGLIEGASENRGLGHEFLRHVMRCRFLFFVLDMAGSEGRDPMDDLKALKKELELYDPVLAARPWCIIANKMDLPEAAEYLKKVKKKFKDVTIFPICAELGEGIPEIKNFLKEKIQEMTALSEEEVTEVSE
ncbi:MAG: GTPase ObgE [Chthoniobacterales bacterium]